MQNHYLSSYEDYLVLSRKSTRTIKIYKSIVASFLKFCNNNPSQVSNKDIIKFILFKEGTRSREQSKGALKHLYKGVLLTPKKMNFIPSIKREQFIPNILTQQEVKILLGNILNLKHKAIINLQYYAALRTGEVVNLKINDIRKDGVIHIRQSKGAKDRLVPINNYLQVLLREYYKRYLPKEFLFNGQNSLMYSSKSIQKIVIKYCKQNNIYRKVRPHDLRHSRATHLHENGMGLKFIQELLGHKSIKSTEAYLHSSKEILKNVIAAAEI